MAAEVADIADRLRVDIVRMAGEPVGAHVGGSLSCADIMAVLHFGVMGTDDTFVLSKGHAAPALYATLAERGDIDRDELDGYARPGSRLFGHPPRTLPGVEFATGSLGHGLSLGIGLALAAQLDGSHGRVFVLLGDGELQEGSVWEALMYAGHRGLSNLVAVIDRNGLQITGATEDTVTLEPLEAKLSAFGWTARTVDGHDHAALEAALRPSQDGPVAVIACTQKGHGVPFLAGRVSSHYVKLRPALIQRAVAGLKARAER